MIILYIIYLIDLDCILLYVSSLLVMIIRFSDDNMICICSTWRDGCAGNLDPPVEISHSFGRLNSLEQTSAVCKKILPLSFQLF